MRLYVAMFLVGGVVIPIAFHVVAADRMPWWPDTVSMGIAFGACAVVMAWKTRADREMNRRLWNVLKTWGTAIGSHFGSN
jgi:hypothetical protein